ncbi:MAG: 50S ribosomal protein L7ae, partial [Candidatus Altiarchaeales archaeon]|nr:50S ribosomal protein L7ae [Candidatus Altiarchaeales archaeon]
VFIGSNVEPPEIVMHLPMICEEKDIAYLYVKKEDIGEAVGIHVPTAAGCIIEEGKAKELVAEVKEKLAEIKSQ